MSAPVFISVRPGGRTIRYTKVGRRWVPTRDNPIEVTGTDLLLLAGGVVALGVVGYFLWVTIQDAQAATAAGEGSAPEGVTSQQGQFVNVNGQPLGSGASTSGIDPSQLQPVTPTTPSPLSPLLSRGAPPPLPAGF